MARRTQGFEFSSFADMARHLDRWASSALVSGDAWEDVLVSSGSWLDYSARNQVLLASYGADGPVAGAETWRLVPSSVEGRGCSVRAGEHGLPVRVPVTTAGVEPDPFVGGVRATRAAVERWEWRPVFELAQLARRPAPGALSPPGLSDGLTGPAAGEEFLAAVRRVGTATVRGRLSRSSDPERVLADAAVRLRRSSKRPALDRVLGSQVAWLVADRVGLASADRPPSFDPSGLAPRERWERLQDVLDPARKLTAALGVQVGVDLTASPLPRMEVVDDRVVSAGRRHRLPRASFEQLPVGRWVSVGPYTEAEWSARGEVGSGRGAFLRLNASAYIAAVEHGDSAAWRLEDVATRTGNGRLAAGTSTSLEAAQADSVAVLADRYPVLSTGSAVVLDAAELGAGRSEWQAMPGEGRSAAELRHLDDDVTVYVIPGPGGRWMPAVHHGPSGSMERLASTRTIDEARTAAELAGHRTIRAMTFTTPTSFDAAVAALAAGSEYSRSELVVAAGPRLEPEDRARLTTAEPPELVELLGAAGVSAASTVAVLDAERVDPQVVARLLPTVGVPIADSVRVLHERWDVPRATSATWLAATAVEMRDAGCSAAEIVALRPVEVLRTLPDDPELWRLAAATMTTSGHPPAVVAGHLVSHAPSLDAFASGLAAGIEDPSVGLGVAATRGASGEQLAAASEAYGLSPSAAAVAVTDAGAEPSQVLDMVSARCDHDLDAVAEIAGGVGIDASSMERWMNPAPTVTSLVAAIDGDDAAALLAALPAPSASPAEFDPARMLDALGLEPSSLEVMTQ